MVEVLVTGGAGFIGSNFVRYALRTHPDWRVTTLDKLTYAGRRENLHDVIDDPRHRFVHGDVADPGVAAPLVRDSNVVVHFAAETHVDRSLLSAGEFITTDVFGTFVLLEAAREARALRRFVQISTDEVYGSVPQGSSRENDELKPRNPYSASKAGADRLAYSYWATYDVPVIITRASNNYGPYQFPEKVIPLFVTNAIDDIQVPLYGDGLNERDWLHVDDHCRAIDLLIDAGGHGEVYNVGGGNDVRNVDLTRRILTLAGKPESLIRHVPDRPGHDRRYSLDTTKLRALGWAPRTPFDAGLAATVDWYRQNEWWWRPIKDADPAFRAYYDTQYRPQPVVTVAASGVPLVTGAAGFAGSHLLERLQRSHNAIAAWSNPGSSRPRPAVDGVQWNAVDLLDAEAVERELRGLRPSVIFHCAGMPQVAESWAQAARALRVNAFGTSLLLDAVNRVCPTSVVVMTGSALVYRPAARPLREDDPLGPSDPYGVSKLAQELAGQRTDAHVVLARPFNHAGPRQPSSFVTSSFARQIAEIEAGRREPVLRVGNLDARRDITDVRDTVRAYDVLSASGRRSRPYNVCSGVAHRVGDLLEMLLGMARLRVHVKQDPDRMRPSDNPLVVGDPSRIQTETGWRAEIPIERTLADLLDWWRGQIAAEAGSAR